MDNRKFESYQQEASTFDMEMSGAGWWTEKFSKVMQTRLGEWKFQVTPRRRLLVTDKMSPTRFDHERLVEGEHEDAFLSRDVAEIQDFLGLERLGREAEVAAAGLLHEIDGLEVAVLVGLKEEKDNADRGFLFKH